MADYPLEILPNQLYKSRLSMDNIVDKMDEFIVGRRIPDNIEKYITTLSNGTQILDLDCLGEHIERMSVNLLGGEFEPYHFKYRCFSNGSKTWNDETVSLSDFSGCYETLSSGDAVYYSSKDLHNKIIPVNHIEVNKDKAKSLKLAHAKALAKTIFSQYPVSIELEYLLFISHEPVMLNYWHVQMEVKPALEENSSLLKNQKSWKSDVFNQICTDILQKKFIKQPAIIPISSCCTCKLERKCKYNF